MLLPKQAISFRQLLTEGFSVKEIKIMYANLKIFPTPFKGIYYVPSQEEQKAAFIETPARILYKAIEFFLDSKDFYFSCNTAEEALGLDWHVPAAIHIVNTKISRRIDLKRRRERYDKRGNWRSKRVSKILSSYGNQLLFHKINNTKNAKTMQTPYGRFALKSQIKSDKRRFGEA